MPILVCYACAYSNQIMTKQEFMAMSLPYDLKAFNENLFGREILSIKGYSFGDIIHQYGVSPIVNIKPILRPLSDLTKEIEHNGEIFIPSVTLRLSYPTEMIGLNPATWSFRVVLKLIEWRFDIANLIKKGEAVDYHTLEGFSF